MSARAPDGASFDLRAQAGAGAAERAAVLCVHGLTGTPYDFRRVGERLAERGMRARAIVLPGHERSPAELARTTWPQWFDAVGEVLTALRAEHGQVFCAGLSLGGLLTLAHAAEEHCDAIAVIGTPLRLPRWMRLALPFLSRWQPLRPKTGGSDICDPGAKACNPGFDAMPLAAVRQMIALQARVEANLARVRVPTLVAHGARDRTANPRDAQRIARTIASERVELLMLERSGHVATVDYDGEWLSERIADFFAECTQLAKPV